MKYLLALIMVITSSTCDAYPWGVRDTYVDGVVVPSETINRCVWFYVKRNEAIVALHQPPIAYPKWAYYSVLRSEFTDYITVFCGFTKIRVTQNGDVNYPKVGRAIFSSPGNKRKWLDNHTKQKESKNE